MTDSGGAHRLTREVDARSRAYWEETAALYDDVIGRTEPDTPTYQILSEQLATAHWRLARLAFRESGVRSGLSPLMRSFRIAPSFVPRRLWSWLSS